MIDNNTANVNGAEKELEVPPMLIEDRTMVPVRFVADALGAQVNWGQDNELVEILPSPENGSEDNYNSIKLKLDSLTAVSVIDGAWPEPYNLAQTEGMTLIIAKDRLYGPFVFCNLLRLRWRTK